MTSQDLNIPSNAGIVEISFTESPVQGITHITLGIGIFSIQDIIIRNIGDTYPGFEIMYIRRLVALVPLGVLVGMAHYIIYYLGL